METIIFFVNCKLNLSIMETIIFKVKKQDDGFVAEAYVAENEHIVTQGDTIEELKLMIKDALECHFDKNLMVEIKDKESIEVLEVIYTSLN